MFSLASHIASLYDVPVFGDGPWISKLYQFKTNKDTVKLSCKVVYIDPLLDIDALAKAYCISNGPHNQGKMPITTNRNNTEKHPCGHAKKFIIGQQRILEPKSPFNIVISWYAYINSLSGNLVPVCAVDQIWAFVLLNKGIFRCIFPCYHGYRSFIVW